MIRARKLSLPCEILLVYFHFGLGWDYRRKVYFSNIFFFKKHFFSKFSSPLWPTEVKRLIFASSHGRRKLRGFGLIFAGTSLANFCLKTSVGSPKSMKKTNFYRLWGNFCWLLTDGSFSVSCSVHASHRVGWGLATASAWVRVVEATDLAAIGCTSRTTGLSDDRLNWAVGSAFLREGGRAAVWAAGSKHWHGGSLAVLCAPTWWDPGSGSSASVAGPWWHSASSHAMRSNGARLVWAVGS
jgi:hypothetical protein